MLPESDGSRLTTEREARILNESRVLGTDLVPTGSPPRGLHPNAMLVACGQ
jgi:hypothetical protein